MEDELYEEFLLKHDKHPEKDQYEKWLAEKIQSLQTQLEERTEKYQEIMMAVESKYPNETRHETALRYIKSCESGSEVGQSVKQLLTP